LTNRCLIFFVFHRGHLSVGADFHRRWWRLPGRKTPDRVQPCEELDPPYDIKLVFVQKITLVLSKINKNCCHQSCRYNWHSASSLDWPFPMLKYSHIFQVKHTEAVLLNNTWKLLRFEVTEMLIEVYEKNYRVIYCDFRHTFVPYRSVSVPEKA